MVNEQFFDVMEMYNMEGTREFGDYTEVSDRQIRNASTGSEDGSSFTNNYTPFSLVLNFISLVHYQ